MKALCIIAILLATSGVASAENLTVYDASGRVTGKSSSSNGYTVFYDPMGRVTGRASTSGSGNITLYDATGRATGHISR